MINPARLMTWPEGRSRQSIVLITSAIVALIGLLDYLLGWQISLAAFYVYPIAIAAWYIGPGFAYLLSILSVALFSVGDVAADFPFSSWPIPVWNAAVRLVFYAILIHMLDYIRSLTAGLEARVLERTSDLRREIGERERLERELLEVGGRERRRLGYDLHDGLGQHLTGTALAVQVLSQKLAQRGAPEAAEAAKAVDLIEDGIALSRKLAKGLQPVETHAGGLMHALQEFAVATTDLFKVACRFECEAPILFADASTADHLYHIAREATGNAVKHGRARNVTISLDARDEGSLLTVRDDGIGIPVSVPKNGGMGLTIMAQRAKLIGASSDIRATEAGTLVSCCLPQPSPGLEYGYAARKQDPHYA
jgi:signal transduction histidine kinase